MTFFSLLPMMAALYGVGLANIFLRSSMGVLAPELARELSLSPIMLGAIASAFFLSYALFQIPTGMLLDRFGARRTVGGLFVFTVVGSFLFALAPSGPVMLLARLLMGVGCAGVFAGAFMIFGRFFAAERFTTMGGALNSFAMLGTFLATAPLAYLVIFAGWRLSFLVVALLVGAIALLAVASLRDHPAGQPRPRLASHGEDFAAVLRGVKVVLGTRGILGIASGGIALSAGSTILGIWGGPYLNDVHGLAEVPRGSVLLFMALAGVVGHFAYGQAARYLNTHKWLVLGGVAANIIIMTALAALSAPPLWLVTCLFAALSFACGFPTIMIAHARGLVPEHLIGRGMTTVNTGIMISIALMQAAFGAWVGIMSETGGADFAQGTETGYRYAFGFVALMSVMTFLIYARVKDVKPRR